MVKNPPAVWETEFHRWVGKIPWKREQLPLQYSGLENSIDRGSWYAGVHRVAESDGTEHLSLVPGGRL